MAARSSAATCRYRAWGSCKVLTIPASTYDISQMLPRACRPRNTRHAGMQVLATYDICVKLPSAAKTLSDTASGEDKDHATADRYEGCPVPGGRRGEAAAGLQGQGPAGEDAGRAAGLGRPPGRGRCRARDQGDHLG